MTTTPEGNATSDATDFLVEELSSVTGDTPITPRMRLADACEKLREAAPLLDDLDFVFSIEDERVVRVEGSVRRVLDELVSFAITSAVERTAGIRAQPNNERSSS